MKTQTADLGKLGLPLAPATTARRGNLIKIGEVWLK